MGDSRLKACHASCLGEFPAAALRVAFQEVLDLALDGVAGSLEVPVVVERVPLGVCAEDAHLHNRVRQRFSDVRVPLGSASCCGPDSGEAFQHM